MRKILASIAVVVCAAGQTTESAKTAVLATVHQFVDGFNKGDTKAAVAACADQTSIIDEFPPHEWHGAGACAKWISDYDANAKKDGITGGIVTLSEPWHVDVSAGRAYVVAPVNYTFSANGKPMKETGSIITLALRKVPAGWRITGWAWSKR